MSLTLIEIDGQLYHAQDIYDEESENIVDTVPLVDENGNMIPASYCLCYAHEPSECVCATTAWEGWRYDDEDYWRNNDSV